MKIQILKKIVQNVKEMLQPNSQSVHDQDLNEYEKVKREVKTLNAKKVRTPQGENRDVSAI